MQRILSASAILLLAFSVGSAGDKKGKEVDNPFKTAKVGDYINYKLSTKIGDFAVDGNLTQTVTARDEKTVTVEAVGTVLGKKTPPQKTEIDLTKPFDPTSAATQGKGKFEKTGEGKEKIKVGGKEYDTTWISGKAVAEAGGLKIESTVKVWFSKQVPLNGMVKMETKADLANVTIELSDHGSKDEKK